MMMDEDQSGSAIVRVDVFYGDDLDAVHLVKLDAAVLRELQAFIDSGRCDAMIVAQLTELIPEVVPALAGPVEQIGRRAREYLAAAFACKSGEPVALSATFQRQLK